MITRLTLPHFPPFLQQHPSRPPPAIYYYLTTATCLTLSYITLRRLFSSSASPSSSYTSPRAHPHPSTSTQDDDGGDGGPPPPPLLTPPTSIPSPLRTLIPRLTPSHLAALPYPPDCPDLLPGRRDVQTPYGTVRAYEFGSASPAARKVLFVHGISTPCVSLLPVANELLAATRGACRVCLFDLFGRGYSDAPADLPYDGRLYASQIQFVVNSMGPLRWDRFTLVGYSLGGGIAVDYASWCPGQVEEVVSIAGGGLVRRADVSLRSKVLYSQGGWVPESWLRAAVKRRLKGPASSSSTTTTMTTTTTATTTATAQKSEGGTTTGQQDGKDVIDAIRQEVPKGAGETTREAETGVAPLAPSSPPSPFDIAAVVDWQLEHHQGFVHAYMSSIRHAPIHDQHHRWKVVGQRQEQERRRRRRRRQQQQQRMTAQGQDQGQGQGRRRYKGEVEGEGEGEEGGEEVDPAAAVDSARAEEAAGAFDSTRLLLIFGADDPLVKPAEMVPDAEACMGGAANVAAHVVAGAGHEVAITHAGECVAAMLRHWEEGAAGAGEQ